MWKAESAPKLMKRNCFYVKVLLRKVNNSTQNFQEKCLTAVLFFFLALQVHH